MKKSIIWEYSAIPQKEDFVWAGIWAKTHNNTENDLLTELEQVINRFFHKIDFKKGIHSQRQGTDKRGNERRKLFHYQQGWEATTSMTRFCEKATDHPQQEFFSKPQQETVNNIRVFFGVNGIGREVDAYTSLRLRERFLNEQTYKNTYAFYELLKK